MTDKETSIREQELLARIVELEAENAFLRLLLNWNSNCQNY